jgi:uncharacterized protein YeeX (DUF496 family)
MEKKSTSQFDLTQVSKKQLDKSKRIEEQAADFLKLHDQRLREEQELLEKKNREALASGAMFSKNSIYTKNKNRTNAIKEAITYTDRATKAAMTDILSTIVEGSLLVDSEEYSKLNPSYKAEIRGQISELLEKGNIQKIIKNKKTLKLIEHVAKAIPDVKTGVYLKEEELIDIVRKSTPAELSNVINSLTGDVKKNVANYIVREQDRAAEIEKEVNDLSKTGEEAKQAKDSAIGAQPQQGAPAGAQIPPELAQVLQQAGITMDQNGNPVGPDGQPVPPEAIQQLLQQVAGQQGGAPAGQPAAQDQAAQVGAQAGPGAQIPPELAQILQQAGITMDENGNPVGPDGQPVPPEVIQQLLQQVAGQGSQQPGLGITNPAPQFDEYGQEVEQPEIAAQPQAQQSAVPQTANKNTAVEIAPDGTVRVNIVRERFYREQPKQGILESLTLNEALDMVKAGKPYNGDLALANALAHLTVLETFNATGLIPISELDYARMLNLPLRKKSLKEEGEAAAQPVATSDAPAKEHTPVVKKDDVHTSQTAEELKSKITESWKNKVLKELNRIETDKPWNKKLQEEGEAAAQPIATSDAPAKEHTPVVKKDDVHTSQTADEVSPPIIESNKPNLRK